MIKSILVAVCCLAVAGCAANNAEVTPVKAAAEPAMLVAPKPAPVVEAISAASVVPEKSIAAVEQPKTQMPTMLTFKKNVSFNHKTHSESFACDKCHKDSPGKIANFGKDSAHETCKGCHAEKGKSTSCKTCHG